MSQKEGIQYLFSKCLEHGANLIHFLIEDELKLQQKVHEQAQSIFNVLHFSAFNFQTLLLLLGLPAVLRRDLLEDTLPVLHAVAEVIVLW